MASRQDVSLEIHCGNCNRINYSIFDLATIHCVYCGADWADAGADVQPVAGPFIGSTPADDVEFSRGGRSDGDNATISAPPATVQIEVNYEQYAQRRTRLEDDRRIRAVSVALLVSIIAVLVIFTAFDMMSRTETASAQFGLDREWQEISIDSGAKALRADGPFRVRVNGELYFVPQGGSVTVPPAGLHGLTEARAAGRPVMVEIIY